MPLNNDDVVMYATNGLIDKFAHVTDIIAHRYPFPDLVTVRSIVTIEDIWLNSKQQSLSIDVSPSTPTVLLVVNDTSRDNRSRDARDSRDNRDSRSST